MLALQFRIPSSQLESQRDRFGMDTMGPADHDRPAMTHRLLADHIQERLQISQEEVTGFHQLQRQRRIDDVGTREAEVEKAACFLTDRLDRRPDEGDHIVIDLGLDLPASEPSCTVRRGSAPVPRSEPPPPRPTPLRPRSRHATTARSCVPHSRSAPFLGGYSVESSSLFTHLARTAKSTVPTGVVREFQPRKNAHLAPRRRDPLEVYPSWPHNRSLSQPLDATLPTIRTACVHALAARSVLWYSRPVRGREERDRMSSDGVAPGLVAGETSRRGGGRSRHSADGLPARTVVTVRAKPVGNRRDKGSPMCPAPDS
jgi:hypothetical protein